MSSQSAHNQPKFAVQIAKTGDDLRAAQRLRYDVFVKELGAVAEGHALSKAFARA